jgi:hypothetical protein
VTFVEFLDYCATYADSIYVRAEVRGKWGNYSLTELPISEALAWVKRWADEGRIPVRVKAPGESAS